MIDVAYMATCAVCREDVDTRTGVAMPQLGAGRLFRHADCPAPKAEVAARRYAFIVEQANAGKTVYLQTTMRTTVIKKKHLPWVRVKNGALEIRCGKRWIDYTLVDKVSAQ